MVSQIHSSIHDAAATSHKKEESPTSRKRPAIVLETEDAQQQQQQQRSSPIAQGIATIGSILETPTLLLSNAQTAGLIALRDHLTKSELSPSDNINKKHEKDEQQASRGKRRRSSVPQILLDFADSDNEAATYLEAEYSGMTKYCFQPSDVKVKDQLRAHAMEVLQEQHTFRSCLEPKQNKSLGRVAMVDPAAFRPKEWDALNNSDKVKLAQMLSWDNLQRWDFDVVELEKLTKGHSLLFVGWALFASPHAQIAMTTSTTTTITSQQDTHKTQGYNFVTTYSLHPQTLCAFLHHLQSHYLATNPYHNATHAADILQTTHALLQMGGKHYSSNALQIFGLLLAAAVHDVGHPGTNNGFQVRLQTDLARKFRNESVLENMHLELAFRTLLGTEQREEMNVLKGMIPEEKAWIRSFVIKAVKGTDMSRHLPCLENLKQKLEELQDEDGSVDPVSWLQAKTSTNEGEEETAAEVVLQNILHLADISSPAKPPPLVTHWSNKILEEFFAQGDLEREHGHPISPLCDRFTVSKPEIQVGFIKFVVRPAYEVLGKVVRRVEEEVLPVLEGNLRFWEQEVEKETKKDGGGGAGRSGC